MLLFYLFLIAPFYFYFLIHIIYIFISLPPTLCAVCLRVPTKSFCNNFASYGWLVGDLCFFFSPLPLLCVSIARLISSHARLLLF